jgi:hypothetical protein
LVIRTMALLASAVGNWIVNVRQDKRNRPLWGNWDNSTLNVNGPVANKYNNLPAS